MGYTHYWDDQSFTDEQWELICKDAQGLFKASLAQGIQLVQDYENVDTLPEITEERILFNGVGDDGHEAFVIDRTKSGFEFCKTAAKPYDDAVVALLAIVHHHEPSFTWRSDGTPSDHKAGLALAATVNPDITETGHGDRS